ncbi:MAG: hypothetical protein LBJ00_01995 [Planctomycetaceae bacterium]|jgi:hypothetical protein|nr:hypothetical protein [Planctomycetaceae bacterium]
MKKLLALALVVVMSLFTIGCDDSSSSSTDTQTNSASTTLVASYTTAWPNNGSTSAYYYDIRYSVTAVPFEGVSYDKATDSFNGPLSSMADINYVGTGNVQDNPYLTHWDDGTSTYSCKPFDGVTYRQRTVYNNEDDGYYYSSYYMSYVLYEGTATDGSRSDFELEGDVYINQNVVDNDGRVTRVDSNE